VPDDFEWPLKILSSMEIWDQGQYLENCR